MLPFAGPCPGELIRPYFAKYKNSDRRVLLGGVHRLQPQPTSAGNIHSNGSISSTFPASQDKHVDVPHSFGPICEKMIISNSQPLEEILVARCVDNLLTGYMDTFICLQSPQTPASLVLAHMVHVVDGQRHEEAIGLKRLSRINLPLLEHEDASQMTAHLVGGPTLIVCPGNSRRVFVITPEMTDPSMSQQPWNVSVSCLSDSCPIASSLVVLASRLPDWHAGAQPKVEVFAALAGGAFSDIPSESEYEKFGGLVAVGAAAAAAAASAASAASSCLSKLDSSRLGPNDSAIDAISNRFVRFSPRFGHKDFEYVSMWTQLRALDVPEVSSSISCAAWSSDDSLLLGLCADEDNCAPRIIRVDCGSALKISGCWKMSDTPLGIQCVPTAENLVLAVNLPGGILQICQCDLPDHAFPEDEEDKSNDMKASPMKMLMQCDNVVGCHVGDWGYSGPYDEAINIGRLSCMQVLVIYSSYEGHKHRVWGTSGWNSGYPGLGLIEVVGQQARFVVPPLDQIGITVSSLALRQPHGADLQGECAAGLQALLMEKRRSLAESSDNVIRKRKLIAECLSLMHASPRNNGLMAVPSEPDGFEDLVSVAGAKAQSVPPGAFMTSRSDVSRLPLETKEDIISCPLLQHDPSIVSFVCAQPIVNSGDWALEIGISCASEFFSRTDVESFRLMFSSPAGNVCSQGQLQLMLDVGSSVTISNVVSMDGISPAISRVPLFVHLVYQIKAGSSRQAQPHQVPSLVGMMMLPRWPDSNNMLRFSIDELDVSPLSSNNRTQSPGILMFFSGPSNSLRRALLKVQDACSHMNRNGQMPENFVRISNPSPFLSSPDFNFVQMCIGGAFMSLSDSLKRCATKCVVRSIQALSERTQVSISTSSFGALESIKQFVVAKSSVLQAMQMLLDHLRKSENSMIDSNGARAQSPAQWWMVYFALVNDLLQCQIQLDLLSLSLSSRCLETVNAM